MTLRRSFATVATVLLAGAWASSAYAPTAEAPVHGMDGPRDAAPVAPTGQRGAVGSIGTADAGGRAATTPAPARVAALVADQLRRYLARVFSPSTSQRTLHGHIRQVSVGLHLAAIHTDLSSTERDRAVAEQICAVVSRFRYSPEGRHVTSLDVEVYGPDGQLLAIYEDLPARVIARAISRPPRPPGATTPTPAAGMRPTRSALQGTDPPGS